MIITGTIYDFGKPIFFESNSKKSKKLPKEEAKDPDEAQIIEEYEGDCEKCETDRPQKICEVCGV